MSFVAFVQRLGDVVLGHSAWAILGHSDNQYHLVPENTAPMRSEDASCVGRILKEDEADAMCDKVEESLRPFIKPRKGKG